jgi:hypothetical protein
MRKDLLITGKGRGLSANRPWSSSSSGQGRTGRGGGLGGGGAGNTGNEELSLGTKRIEGIETNTMGGSPRAEDDGIGRISEVNRRRLARSGGGAATAWGGGAAGIGRRARGGGGATGGRARQG